MQHLLKSYSLTTLNVENSEEQTEAPLPPVRFSFCISRSIGLSAVAAIILAVASLDMLYPIVPLASDAFEYVIAAFSKQPIPMALSWTKAFPFKPMR